ncbi:hypothetical protein N7535_009572 [Penicillium sp. DV-2018c]|nr:hypothetical protein N7461_002057 [Penicillium sp. DV-2018c]KAJ5559344.1 hypothetical protein N7535_009572 [Penicillium sp. DV-2018c]
MRFPLPLSLHLARISILHFLLFPSSYLPLPFPIVRRSRFQFFRLVIWEFCFVSLVADYSFFASRISSVFPGFPNIQVSSYRLVAYRIFAPKPLSSSQPILPGSLALPQQSSATQRKARAFYACLFAWLRYDLITRRSFLNDSTKF